MVREIAGVTERMRNVNDPDISLLGGNIVYEMRGIMVVLHHGNQVHPPMPNKQ